MGKVFSFHGGIHPPENKHQSTQSPIVNAPLANVLNVPIQQHIGAPAKPCVQVGDSVLKGQRIADEQGKFSVPVHAPSSGVIRAIGEHSVPHPSGMQGVCISIETDGKDQWIEHSPLSDYQHLSKDQLIDYIRDRGIAGMGGAGFPTAMKLHLGDNHIVNTLIINAAECEPYISADDLLMRERADQIIKGIDVLQYLLEPSHIIIGVEDNKPQAIRALEQAISQCEFKNCHNIDVVSIPTKYPSGGEKQLIKLLTNVEVPNGGIPADVGIVCQNVGTVYAIHRAVCHGESLISRIVTVTGDGVAKPQNYETLIGTPFSLLLETAGQYIHKTSRLIVGGPMMGYSIADDAIPVVKTSNCIIATTEQEMPNPDPEQACIRCGMCEQVCPVQLLPQQLHWFSKGQEHDKAMQHNLFDCIECGACSYVCPSNIPLVQYYRHTKTSIREEQQDKRKSDLARERFEAKQMREQRAIDEKAAKRKERAEQAAKAQSAKALSAKAQEDSGATASNATDKPAAKPVDVLKKLNSAVLVAQAKIKKAQQDCDKHTQEGDTNALATSSLILQKAQLALEKAQQAVTAHTNAVKDPQPQVPDEAQIKKLKIAAAQANTKVLKAQQALKAAQEKGLPGVEQLQKTIATLQIEADGAAKAYQNVAGDTKVANAARTQNAVNTDNNALAETKKLKTAAAIARTKLKKIQGQLNKAQALEQDDDSQQQMTQLEQQLVELTTQAEQAQAAYQTSLDKATAASTTPVVDLKKLKTAAAIARTKLKKAQSQLDELENLNDSEQSAEQAASKAELKAQVQALTEKMQQTQASYLSAKSADSSNDNKDKAADSTQELQDNYDKASKLYDKANVALQKAQQANSPAVEKMITSIEKLKGRRDNAYQALNTSTSSADPE
jgi:electron transport complex protein RnfC